MDKDIVLAYTAGLDAVASLHWLSQRGVHVVTFTGDIGQNDDLDVVRRSAVRNGAGCDGDVEIADLRMPFVTDFIFPALRANAVYEGRYLMGGALPKPLLARTHAEIAKQRGIATLAHGATAGQNDRIRFEKTYRRFHPECRVYVPWEDPEFSTQFPSRERLLAYVKEHGLQSTTTTSRPWTTESHLYHRSFEDIDLADFSCPRRRDMIEVEPVNAPDEPAYLEITFERGNPVQVFHGDKTYADPVEMLRVLNDLGSRNAVGIVDMIETNLDGRKTRGVYVTPGGTILRVAHMDIEGATMPGHQIEERDTLVPRFSRMIYAGDWFAPEMTELRRRMDSYQDRVSGIANLTLYKGNVIIEGRTV